MYFIGFVLSWYVALIFFEFGMVPIAPIITDISFDFTLHMHYIPIVSS